MALEIIDVYCSYTEKYLGTKFSISPGNEPKLSVSHGATYLALREKVYKGELGKTMGLENDEEMKKIEEIVKQRDSERLLKSQG